MSDPQRTRLSRWSSLLGRSTAYLIPEGIELESTQNYEVIRRRVFFDDVLMVTIHREQTPLYLAMTGLFGLFFLTVAFVLLATDAPVVASLIFFVIGGLPFIAFVLRLILGMEVVTVIGRRSKAALHFRGRSRRAREIYGSLCNTVRETHRRLEREYAEEIPGSSGSSGSSEFLGERDPAEEPEEPRGTRGTAESPPLPE